MHRTIDDLLANIPATADVFFQRQAKALGDELRKDLSNYDVVSFVARLEAVSQRDPERCATLMAVARIEAGAV